MRVPVVYTATEIVNWHVAEEYAPGKWRPSRCCPFDGWCHLRTRLRIAWAVFTGRYDALNWGESSGERSAEERNYRDCTEPGWTSATKVKGRL